MTRPTLDSMARGVVTVAVVAGGLGIGWGMWESHAAARDAQQAVNAQGRIDHLLAEHTHDLKIEAAQQDAIRGAVAYVERSIGALCVSVHASCPVLPRA